jgi:hypothetical protein
VSVFVSSVRECPTDFVIVAVCLLLLLLLLLVQAPSALRSVAWMLAYQARALPAQATGPQQQRGR